MKIKIHKVLCKGRTINKCISQVNVDFENMLVSTLKRNKVKQLRIFLPNLGKARSF